MGRLRTLSGADVVRIFEGFGYGRRAKSEAM